MINQTFPQSDFSLGQCRNALADFDHSTVEQALLVMTSGDQSLVQKATRDEELSRAIFWIQEWMNVERISSKSEGLTRLKIIPAIRAQRQEKTRFNLAGLNAALIGAVVIGQTVFWFTA